MFRPCPCPAQISVVLMGVGVNFVRTQALAMPNARALSPRKADANSCRPDLRSRHPLLSSLNRDATGRYSPPNSDAPGVRPAGGHDLNPRRRCYADVDLQADTMTPS